MSYNCMRIYSYPNKNLNFKKLIRKFTFIEKALWNYNLLDSIKTKIFNFTKITKIIMGIL